MGERRMSTADKDEIEIHPKEAVRRRRRRHTAIHEAGHAVIARVLGLSSGEANIIPNEQEDVAGCATVYDGWKTANEWDQQVFEQRKRGVVPRKVRLARSAFRGLIIVKMAGAEAESELLGDCAGGDGYDREEIELIVHFDEAELSYDLWRRHEPRMRRQARRLVRKHRDKIERVAAALVRRKILTGPEIDRLMVSQGAQ
jgi:hypothetical protein